MPDFEKLKTAVSVPICSPSHPNKWKINKTKKTAKPVLKVRMPNLNLLGSNL